MTKPAKPTTGEKWHMPSFVKGTPSFATLIGNYQTSGPTPFVNEMSVHFYRLGVGEKDLQRPHQEDELYYVLEGSRVLHIEENGVGTDVELQTGDLVYVPAKAHHKFIGDDSISLLVFFAPNYTGPRESSPDL